MKKGMVVLAAGMLVAGCGALSNIGAARVNFTSTPHTAEVWIDARSELKPLHLSAAEQRELVAFLRTLSGPLSAPVGKLDPPGANREQ